MYTSVASTQSKVGVEKYFPLLQTEQRINVGDCYQDFKLTNIPNFFIERK